MTNEMMNLRARFWKRALTPTYCAKLIGFTAQRLMELEVEGLQRLPRPIWETRAVVCASLSFAREAISPAY